MMKTYKGTKHCPKHGEFEWFVSQPESGEVIVGNLSSNVRNIFEKVIEVKCPVCDRSIYVNKEELN